MKHICAAALLVSLSQAVNIELLVTDEIEGDNVLSQINEEK